MPASSLYIYFVMLFLLWKDLLDLSFAPGAILQLAVNYW